MYRRFHRRRQSYSAVDGYRQGRRSQVDSRNSSNLLTEGIMDIENKKAVVLLSGGLDSATVLAIARSQGYELYALSFSYGQRHIWELEAAARVAASIGVAKHRVATIDLRIFGGSALTDEIDVPKGR